MARRLRTRGGDNALILDRLPNLDLGDSESPAEELEEDKGAKESLCRNDMDRACGGIEWSSNIFAGQSFAKLGISGDPSGDEGGLGIGGSCMLLALDEACPVFLGDRSPCLACARACSSGAFPNVWRLGGAGSGCAA